MYQPPFSNGKYCKILVQKEDTTPKGTPLKFLTTFYVKWNIQSIHRSAVHYGSQIQHCFIPFCIFHDNALIRQWQHRLLKYTSLKYDFYSPMRLSKEFLGSNPYGEDLVLEFSSISAIPLSSCIFVISLFTLSSYPFTISWWSLFSLFISSISCFSLSE